jgi:hypothetical protein
MMYFFPNLSRHSRTKRNRLVPFGEMELLCQHFMTTPWLPPCLSWMFLRELEKEDLELTCPECQGTYRKFCSRYDKKKLQVCSFQDGCSSGSYKTQVFNSLPNISLPIVTLITFRDQILLTTPCLTTSWLDSPAVFIVWLFSLLIMATSLMFF